MTRASVNTSEQSVAADVLAELEQDKPVRLHLPGGGRLHLDRRLPFICVYRRRAEEEDRGTEQLVTTEPCHMIVPAEPRSAAHALDLLRQIVAGLADEFGSFLLIEMWSAPLVDPPEGAPPINGDGDLIQPRFEIIAPSARIPRFTVDALSQSLGKDMLPFGASRVVLGRYEEISPPGLRPLLRLNEIKERNGFALGIVVRPVYRESNSQELYPAVLRSIRHHIHSALQQAYFSFTQARTSLRLRHYQALGSRTVLKAVFDIDRQLVEIARSYDLLLQATPVNAEGAWREFRRSGFEKRPAFFYRPLPIDPTLLKRQLYLIPVERIEDPTLSYLFRQKQDELDRQITLLSDVDTPRFLPESVQIYGGVSDWLLRQAREVLDRVPPREDDEPGPRQLTATEFAKLAQQELGFYQQQRTDFRASVCVRDDMYAGMMVSRDQLLVGGNLHVPRRRVEALLQHEVGTHLVTRYNGHVQPFQQLEIGLAGYDGLQEGLAVLAEYLVGGLGRMRMRVLAIRVVAARQLLDGASFVDTFRTLERDFGCSQQIAFTTTMRAYRGGGLTKDAVYLRGLLQILRFLREGGELELLFVGKVAAAHIPLIQELSHRQVIKPPALRPRYLDHPQAGEKLQRLRAGMNLMDLLEPDEVSSE